MSLPVGGAILFAVGILFYESSFSLAPYQWVFLITAFLGLSPFIFGNFASQGKRLLEAQIKFYEAKADYYRKRAA